MQGLRPPKLVYMDLHAIDTAKHAIMYLVPCIRINLALLNGL